MPFYDVTKGELFVYYGSNRYVHLAAWVSIALNKNWPELATQSSLQILQSGPS